MFCSRCGKEIQVDLRMAYCPMCGVEYNETMRSAIRKHLRENESKKLNSYQGRTFQGEKVGVYDLDMDDEWGKMTPSDLNINFDKVKLWIGRAILVFVTIMAIRFVCKAFVCANCGEIHIDKYRYESFGTEEGYLCHDCAEDYYVFLDVERFRE